MTSSSTSSIWLLLLMIVFTEFNVHVFSSWCIDIVISISILLNFKLVGDFPVPFIFVCFEMFYFFN